MRNRELEVQKYSKPWTWRDRGKPLANIDIVFILPIEFRAPSKYEQEESNEEWCDEEELGEAMA